MKSGTFAVLGGGTNTHASYTSDSGAALGIGGNTTFDANSSIQGAGTVSFFGSGTIVDLGPYNVTGTTESHGPTTSLQGTITSLGSTLNMMLGTLDLSTATFGAGAGTIATIVGSGGSVNFGSEPLSVQTLTMTGATLTDTGAIVVSGVTTVTGGTLAGGGSGTVTANGGITINPAANVVILNGVTLTNAAGQIATWTLSDSNIEADNGSVFNNDGTFNAQNQGAFNTNVGTIAVFNNNGVFTYTDANTSLVFSRVTFNSTNGSVTVAQGELSLDGGGAAASSSYTVDSGTILDFAGGVYTFDSGSSFAGAGTIETQGATVTMNGNSPGFTGSTNLVTGELFANGSQPNSAVSLGNATLAGIGSVGPLAATAGTVQPGDALGILTIQGNANLTNAAYSETINGAVIGSEFSELVVNGTATLGASLSVALGFIPTPGTVFTIIHTTGGVTGSFSNVAQGASITVNGIALTVNYQANNGHDVTLSNAPLSLLASSTALVSSTNPSNLGASVTFTATVTEQAGGGQNPPVPTGSVQFFDGSTSLGTVNLNSLGVASFQTLNLAGGTHAITADYLGDGNYQTSVSNTVSQVVNPASTSVTVAPSINPSNLGQAVTFTATLTPSSPELPFTPTGLVQFFDGSTSLGTKPIASNTAVLQISTLSGGSHPITAEYLGNSNFAKSVSSSLNQAVLQAPTSVSLSSSASAVAERQPFILTATVTTALELAVSPTGSVEFLDGLASLGIVPISGGTAVLETSTAIVGAHSIEAKYLGDSNFLSSTSNIVTIVVTAASTPPVTNLTAALISPQSPITNVNQPTFAGSANAGATIELLVLPQGGRVPILAGTTQAGTNGTWSITTNPLADGIYTVTAEELGSEGSPVATVLVLPSNGSGPLVIDTTPPVITAVQLENFGGRIDVTFQSGFAGMNTASLVDSNAYIFFAPFTHIRPVKITSISLEGQPAPSDIQTVVLTINGGRRIKHARYVLAVSGNRVLDLAGNALDGWFCGHFPTGNHHPGSNFEAILPTNGVRSYPAQQISTYPSLESPSSRFFLGGKRFGPVVGGPTAPLAQLKIGPPSPLARGIGNSKDAPVMGC